MNDDDEPQILEPSKDFFSQFQFGSASTGASVGLPGVSSTSPLKRKGGGDDGNTQPLKKARSIPASKPGKKGAQKSQDTEQVKLGIPPVVTSDPAPTLLILGSGPSDTSLRRQQYYAHEQNHFWKVMGTIFDFDSELTYAERIECLCKKGVALWDVLASFKRKGSMDNAITDPVVNDLAAFLHEHPTIKTVGLNGGTAATYFKRYVGTISQGRLGGTNKTKRASVTVAKTVAAVTVAKTVAQPPVSASSSNNNSSPNSSSQENTNASQGNNSQESKSERPTVLVPTRSLPRDLRIVELPSTSPAHAMKDAVKVKTEKWLLCLGKQRS